EAQVLEQAQRICQRGPTGLLPTDPDIVVYLTIIAEWSSGILHPTDPIPTISTFHHCLKGVIPCGTPLKRF
ncbi:hypothetical protein ACUWC3_28170, partial [Klebsiella pneumoniae]|uniref:hypothetical protein n=1 Tax=Klebsiella pneumoniae TaxID=573 RepID=UPI0040555AB0